MCYKKLSDTEKERIYVQKLLKVVKSFPPFPFPPLISRYCFKQFSLKPSSGDKQVSAMTQSKYQSYKKRESYYKKQGLTKICTSV